MTELVARVVVDGLERDVPLRPGERSRTGERRFVAVHPVAHREPLTILSASRAVTGLVAVDLIELEA